MLAILLLISFSAFADSESKFAFDKSFPRDNTFCSHKGKKLELLIRGSNKFIEPKERGYGELIFVRNLPSKKAQLLKLNSSRLDTLKLFSGVSPFCSKSHGYQLDSDTFAVLLQKENRPFADKLVIQLFKNPGFVPGEIIDTNYPTDKAIKTDEGFAFRTFPENHSPQTGRVIIDNESFIFQEKSFPVWIDYSLNGFSVNQQMTFEKFPWKKAFIDANDFLTFSGWNDVEKKFSRKIVYLAVNHKLKKQCLLFIETKQKPNGTETWRCQGL